MEPIEAHNAIIKAASKGYAGIRRIKPGEPRLGITEKRSS